MSEVENAERELDAKLDGFMRRLFDRSLGEGERRRVVVTGMGALTPLGNTVGDFWEGLVAGRSGIARMTLIDPTGYPCTYAGEIKDFDPRQHMEAKEARRMARFSQLAVAATRLALENASLDLSREDHDRMGVLLAMATAVSPTSRRRPAPYLPKGA